MEKCRSGQDTRVTRLEWRKHSFQLDPELTSHTWLEAILADGIRLRFELYSDVGLVETILVGMKDGDRHGLIYRNRYAEHTSFLRPITGESLRSIVHKVARELLVSDEGGSHVFVREVWNSIVARKFQRFRYPSLLGNWQGHNEKLSEFHSLKIDMCTDGTGDKISDANGGTRIVLCAQREEGSRISGVVSLPIAIDNDDSSVTDVLFDALHGGAVFFLDGDTLTLQPMSLPVASPDKCLEAWVEEWLPEDVEAAQRLGSQIASMDVIEVLRRILMPHADGQASVRMPPVIINGKSVRLRSAPLGISWQSSHFAVRDVCCVVLNGVELRLAIYAVLDQRNGPPVRLRAISGNARGRAENSFIYTLRDISECSAASGIGCVHEELGSLQAALRTGDWGFVTLL